MIKTILIEADERFAKDFQSQFEKVSSDWSLDATLDSIDRTVDYLTHHPEPDLVFCDVQLGDALSFEIFNRVRVECPVVFITGIDHYVLNAFEHNGIDYLFKPVEDRELARTLHRYRSFERHFNRYRAFVNQFHPRPKTRLLVKKGIEYVSIKTEDIVLIYTEEKLVFVMDAAGKKYLVDKKMIELEQELDGKVFFRANRQYIVNIGFIRSYKSFEKVKLQVDLIIPELRHQIIISQETAPYFRKWMNEL